MGTLGVSGPSSGLSQFLTSLATSGTTPSQPVGKPGPPGVATSSSAAAADASTNSPTGTATSAPVQSRAQQLALLIQTTINTLNSDSTANPLDALQSIEASPGLGGLLGQLNVDPQQFRSDVLAALTQPATGTPDLSQVFQSFPPGQSLNTLA